MEKIRSKHTECIRELARLEEELRLQEEHSDFRNRCQEKEGKLSVWFLHLIANRLCKTLNKKHIDLRNFHTRHGNGKFWMEFPIQIQEVRFEQVKLFKYKYFCSLLQVTL